MGDDNLLDKEGNVFEKGWDGEYRQKAGLFGPETDRGLLGPNIKSGFLGDEEARGPFGGPKKSVDGDQLYVPNHESSGGSGISDQAAAGLAGLVIVVALAVFAAFVWAFAKAVGWWWPRVSASFRKDVEDKRLSWTTLAWATPLILVVLAIVGNLIGGGSRYPSPPSTSAFDGGQTGAGGGRAALQPDVTLPGVRQDPAATVVAVPTPFPTPTPTSAPALDLTLPDRTSIAVLGSSGSSVRGATVTIGGAFRASLVSATEQDVWALRLPAGKRLEITAVVQGGPVYLTMWSPLSASGNSTQILPFGTCNEGASCQYTFEGPLTGTYRLFVQGAQGVQYSLASALMAQPAASDFKNLAGTVKSDTPGTAIAIGAQIYSVVDLFTKSRDVFSIRLAAGQKVVVDLVPLEDNGALLNAVFGLMADGIRNGAWTETCHLGTSCNQVFTATAAGTYHLTVETNGDALPYTMTIAQP